MKKLVVIFTLCLFYITGIAQQSSVDVVTLKNGSVIRGKIIEQTGQVIKIYTINRSMVEVKPEEVESMTKESSGTNEQQTVFDEDSFAEGNMIIGGSGSIDYLKQKTIVDGNTTGEYSRTGININPVFAYFISNGLAVGATLPLSLYSSKGDKTYSLGIGPVIKYYTDYLAVLKFEGAFMYSHAPNWKGGSFYMKPGIGMAFFLNPKVSFEPGLFYRLSTEKRKTDFSDTNYKTNSFGIELGLTIFL